MLPHSPENQERKSGPFPGEYYGQKGVAWAFFTQIYPHGDVYMPPVDELRGARVALWRGDYEETLMRGDVRVFDFLDKYYQYGVKLDGVEKVVWLDKETLKRYSFVMLLLLFLLLKQLEWTAEIILKQSFFVRRQYGVDIVNCSETIVFRASPVWGGHRKLF
jgi:hypothetical protein